MMMGEAKGAQRSVRTVAAGWLLFCVLKRPSGKGCGVPIGSLVMSILARQNCAENVKATQQRRDGRPHDARAHRALLVKLHLDRVLVGHFDRQNRLRITKLN